MPPVIAARGLGKHYRLGAALPYRTLRESLADAAGGLLRRSPSREAADRSLWALRDATFEVRQGETLGIVGRNGAGKTTLLKILSRVTEPTTGEARLRGRVASLLEVGTGFHPELTGRENVFLNGAISGMTRREIRAKFDEIIAFAELERFIDTPVKRYSSGMYVRLAFAVAAHLEPEILIVDEVLAVGDAAFQEKCLGRMERVATGGRTVLFVSHNLPAVRTLCPRSLLLDGGRIVADGPTGETLGAYGELLRALRVDATTAADNPAVRRGEGSVRLSAVSLQDEAGRERYGFAMGETVRFVLSYTVFRPMRGLAVYIALRAGATREIVTSVRHVLTAGAVEPGAAGSVCVELPDIALRPGEYPLYIQLSEAVYTRTNFDLIDNLTAPLVVTAPEGPAPADFDPTYPVGLFSVPSRVTLNEVRGGAAQGPAGGGRAAV